MRLSRTRRPDERRVTVCDACQTATCWEGLFMCENARIAGTKELTVRELRQLNLEHPSYWGENL